MSLERFVAAVTQALAAERIPAMLTGSLAAALQGVTRATMDVDLVIDPHPEALDAFVRRMERADFYVSLDAAREALADRSMFNVIDPASGWKADLIIRKLRAFAEEEFARREPSDLLGVPLHVARVEDLIIAKLEWATLGSSARQLEDVEALIAMSGTALDRAYLDRWIQALGLTNAWMKVRQTPPAP